MTGRVSRRAAARPGPTPTPCWAAASGDARAAEDLPRRRARRRQDLRDAARRRRPGGATASTWSSASSRRTAARDRGPARRARGRPAPQVEYKGRHARRDGPRRDPRAPPAARRWSTNWRTPTRRAAAIPSAIWTSRSCSRAGIDVYTTLNIQHVESLNDVVAQITRIRVRETVPDSILDRPTRSRSIDLTPEDLIKRLREGKVYVPQQAERARAATTSRPAT